MSNRIPIYMIFAVIAGFLVIIVMNMATLMGISPAKYISPGDVRGMAVVHNKLLYSLNFEQQSALINIFNRAVPISHSAAESRQQKTNNIPEIQKIIIYRFNAPEIEITPLAYVPKTFSKEGSHPTERLNLVFSAPLWNQDGLMEEASQDQIQELLFKTYDP